jgi:dsRNA-specific ribonuclease
MPGIKIYFVPETVEHKLFLAQEIIGYTFTSIALGLEALQMSGYPDVRHNETTYQVPKNKRLAGLGDAVLDAVLRDLWYESDGNGTEWSKIHDELVGNRALYDRGTVIGIDQCILLNPGFDQRVSEEMVARTMEALIGAVKRDGGMKEVERVMRRVGLMEHPFLAGRGARS